MTDRGSGADPDYPDGSVGRYVRERWGAEPTKRTPRTRQPARRDVEQDHPSAEGCDVPGRADAPARSGRSTPADAAPPAPHPGYPGGGEPGSGCAAPDPAVPFRVARPLLPDPEPGREANASAPGAVRAADPPSARIPEQTPPRGTDQPTGVQVADTAGAGPSAGPGGPEVPGGAAGSGPVAGEQVPARGGSADPDVVTPARVAPPGAPPVTPARGAPPLTPARGIAPSTPPRGAPRWTDPGAMAAQEAQRARSGADLPPADLSSARLLRPAKRPPQSGWRRLVYVLSGRLVNPGESPADIRRRELTARINKPLLGCYKIAMLSLKGGVGKTTTTATLGSTFASLRGDRVVAVDANPDRGTLSQKIPLETSATVRHLLRDAQRVRRYTDVRAYTSQGPSRLEVLASEQDPAVSEAFSEDDYRRTVTLLEHFYNIVLTDCGTGLMHSAMYGVLGVADQLIIVSSGSIDGARSASATMDWLDAHGHQDLVRSSVAVINCVHRSAGGVDLDRVAEHFSARCRAVVRIPFDAHLEEGAEIDLDRLEPATRIALLELAAAVADDFPS